MKRKFFLLLIVVIVIFITSVSLYNFIPFSYVLDSEVSFDIYTREYSTDNKLGYKFITINDELQQTKIRELIETLELRRGFHQDIGYYDATDYIQLGLVYETLPPKWLILSKSTLNDETPFVDILKANQDSDSNAIINPQDITKYLLSLLESSTLNII